MNCVTMNSVKPKALAPGMYAIDVEPLPIYGRNNRKVHLDYLKHLKESVATLHGIVEEAMTIKPLDRSLVFACCSKHMTEDRSRLMNFVKKFIGTVRFGNDHFGAIMGYGDYVIGDGVISRVYYVEGLGYNLFSVEQFCDSDLEVAFKKHSCYVRDTDGVELIKDSCCSNLYTISVEDMMKSSPICLLSKASKNKSCEDLGKLQPTTDTGIFVGYAPSRKAGTPSSTTIDQDAPSPSHSPSSSALHSPSLHQGVAAESTLMEDNLVAPLDNNPFINVFALEPSFDASSSGDVTSAESTYVSQTFLHLGK
nr:copia protein [Tanacetum cinerariifolium]